MPKRVQVTETRGAYYAIPPRVSRGTPRHIGRLLGGMSRQELAAKSGLSPGGLSLIFRGCRAPQAKSIRAIAQALGCTMEDVMRALERDEAAARRLEETTRLLNRVRRGGLD